MKKRLFKFLSMLLILSIVLCNSGPVTVNAEEYETLEIPNYEDMCSISKPGSIGVEKGDCKNFKIIIREYSYCSFSTDREDYVTFNLYSDSSKTNKILDSKNAGEYPSIFLPKGEYYLDLTCNNNADKYDVYSFSFGKTSVVDFMKGIVVKKKNKFYYDLPKFFNGNIDCSFLGLASDDGSMYYDTEYVFNYAYIDESKKSKNNYYNNISYKMYLKDKNSSVKITPTGKTKEILDLEAKGETYDTSKYQEEMKNDSSSKKKKDTKKPIVKGVKNNKTYKKSVKFKVSDKSGIKKVTLNNKKIKVSKAKKGYTVKKKGTYTLKVWDKAGNVRTVKFKIKK